MKKQKVIEMEFKRGELYIIEHTMLVPASFHPEHFRKPTFGEEQYSLGTHSANAVNDLSDYDYCIKGIKIVTTVYHN